MPELFARRRCANSEATAAAVEVEEGAPGLAAALVAAGLVATVDGRTVLVELEDERPWDLVRDAVADLDLPLVSMEQRRRGLEELFR